MSRGPGKLQTLIMDQLQMSSEPMSSADLRFWYEVERAPGTTKNLTAKERRSIRMSVGRALRQLEAAGQIKRDKDGNWYPAKNWKGRDDARRERALLAYHEAGHAVVSLAKGIPVEIVTIKGKRAYAGMVRHPHEPRALGGVYSLRLVKHGKGRRYRFDDIADFPGVDAFGNPVQPNPPTRNYHDHIVVSMAGGMAEAKYLKDGSRWDDREGVSSDVRHIAADRRRLGRDARSHDEYAAECKALITKHWPMIEAVANRLLKEEIIGGSEVYLICERVARHVVRRQHLDRTAS
jgi:hypothetical protein